MTVVTIQFDAHCGTVPFWRSAAKAYRSRTWKGAMRAFAHQHGNAIAILGDDSALIVTADGRERRISRHAVIWRGKPQQIEGV